MTEDEYYAKFYGETTDPKTGNVTSWTPHGSFLRASNGDLISHISYSTQWCKENGKYKKGKEHDFTGVRVDDGYNGCPTCAVCGVSKTYWAIKGGYDD